jgi:hypothetical protein
MATTYTDILRLALPTQGELTGTWGTVVNDNITSMTEEAVAGAATIDSWAADSHTLTSADGTTAESRNAILLLTDTTVDLTGAGELIIPTKTKVYVVGNETNQTITVKTAAGSGVAILDGDSMLVYCDGVNVVSGEAALAAASITVVGVTRLATVAETNTGTLATVAVTPDGLEDWTGSAQVTTVGTIGTGTWSGDVIVEAKLENQSGTNTGDETLSSVNALGVTTVGTIDTGTWEGDVVEEAYLPNATLTAEGVVELATQAEVDAGSDTTRAVTPSTLGAYSGISNTSIADLIAQPDWDYSKTDGTGTAEQPQYMYWTNGSLVLRATLTWGSSGGADGNVTIAVWDYDDGGGYAGVGTETIAYDIDANVTTTTWT